MGARGTRITDAERSLIDFIQAHPECTTEEISDAFGEMADELLDGLTATSSLVSRRDSIELPNGRHRPVIRWTVRLDADGSVVRQAPIRHEELASPYLPLAESSCKRDHILFMAQTLGAYYTAGQYAVCREVGLPSYLKDGRRYGSGQRADFIAVKNDLKEVVIVETKSCWADFTSDSKWTGYLPYCNKLYFASEPEVAERIKQVLADAYPEVGVIAVTLNPHPPRVCSNIAFIKSAKRHDLGASVSIADLLWRMANRSSGMAFGGRLMRGNPFEGQEIAWENFRIRN